MNICILGKIPPIQGGVSNHVLWTAYYLAEAGHNVHIVTNAQEVENDFRFLTLDFKMGDSSLCSPLDHPNIFCHYTEKDRHQLYIPQSNPYVSKLASLAVDVIEKFKCSIIFAYYFEPYCIAANLASNWTQIPFFITHAGSDVGRLIKSPYLKTAYIQMLHHCHGIISTEKLLPFYLENKIDLSKILVSRKHIELVHFKKEKYPQFDFTQYIEYIRHHPSDYIQKNYADLLPQEIDPNLPIIGVYGKTGPYKGHLDLIKILGRLAQKNVRFQLVLLTQGKLDSLKSIRGATQKNKIDHCCWILPFIPPWHVPSFISSCSIVCFLEHNFPIKIHMPGVPQQVLACKTPLLVTTEIAEKQPFAKNMQNLENCMIINPRAVDEFAHTLEIALTDPLKRKEMAEKGHKLIREKILTKQEAMDHTSELFELMSQKAIHIQKSQKIALKDRNLSLKNLERGHADHFSWYINNYQEMLQEYFTVTHTIFPSEFLLASQNFLKTTYKQNLSSAETIDAFADYIKTRVLPFWKRDKLLLKEATLFDTYDFHYIRSKAPLFDQESEISLTALSDCQLNPSIKLNSFHYNLLLHLNSDNKIPEKRTTYVIFKPRCSFYDIGVRELSTDAYRFICHFKSKNNLKRIFLEYPTYKNHIEQITSFVQELLQQNILVQVQKTAVVS